MAEPAEPLPNARREFSLKVRLSTGKDLRLSASMGDTIGQLKKQLQVQEGIDLAWQRWFFSGKLLTDRTRLQETKIDPEGFCCASDRQPAPATQELSHPRTGCGERAWSWGGSGTSGDAPCRVPALPEPGQPLLTPEAAHHPGDPPGGSAWGCAAVVAPLGWGHRHALRLLQEVQDQMSLGRLARPGPHCWAVLVGRGHDLLGSGSPWPGGPRVLGWVEMSPLCT